MKYFIVILLIIIPFFAFSEVMESNGYKLELDSSDIGAIEGMGVPEEKTDSGFTDMILSSDNYDFWRIVIFLGIIIILITFFIYNIRKNQSLKKQSVEDD